MPALSLDVTRGMAHEFNNVLMAIAPYAELIARKPDDPRVSEYAGQINAAVSRGARITQGLLSRGTAPVDVVDVGNVLQSLRTGDSPRTEIRTPSAPLFCAVSTGAFRRAVETLATLLAGSGKATRVIISAELALDHPHATGETSYKSQELVHIKFRSEGFSLQPSDLLHAVAMTRDLIRDSGGQMLIEQSGTGSVIHFFFVGHQQRTSQRPRQQGTSLQRVLVVDDDQLVADAVGAMLASADIAYDIVLAAGEVLPAIERTNPDVVLLDVHLGDADGTAVFRDIIDRWPELPVVFSTGHASSVDLADVVGQPLVGLLQKPYSTDTLIQVLRDVVAETSS